MPVGNAKGDQTRTCTVASRMSKLPSSSTSPEIEVPLINLSRRDASREVSDSRDSYALERRESSRTLLFETIRFGVVLGALLFVERPLCRVRCETGSVGIIIEPLFRNRKQPVFGRQSRDEWGGLVVVGCNRRRASWSWSRCRRSSRSRLRRYIIRFSTRWHREKRAMD